MIFKFREVDTSVKGITRGGTKHRTQDESCKYNGKYSKVIIDRENIVKGDKWTAWRGGERASDEAQQHITLQQRSFVFVPITTSHLAVA